MGAGQHLDRLGQLAVTSDRSMPVPVGPDQVGQHVRIAGIALRARGHMPFTVPGHRHRIHRVDLIPGRQQRLHPWAAVCLNPDHHPWQLLHPAGILADQLMQAGDPQDSLRESTPGQDPSLMVLQLDVVMVFGPIIAEEQLHHVLPLSASCPEWPSPPDRHAAP